VIAGPFIPDELIKQIEVSPFNVAETIRLTDFSEDQVRLLVNHLRHWDERTILLAKRIWSWTCGQPYLTQLICQKLSEIEYTPLTEDVDRIAQSLHREDQRHIVPLLDRWITDSRLVAYIQRILNGERIRFFPSENRRQGTLALLGILKADVDGYCAVRNPIYERALREALEVAGEVNSTKPLLAAHTEERMWSPPLFPELNDALTRRTPALFIGADLPRAVTSLPSRADLARDLARRKGLDEILSLAEVAQRVSQAGNRWEFTDFIRNALDTTGKSPQPFHQRVVALVKEHQIEMIITTAYDNLLELAFQQAGGRINRVVRGSDVSFIKPDHPTLIKLYGDAQQPDTLVVTDRDHSDLLRDRDKEVLLDEVRRAFRRNTVLFLGYNLSDPDFRFLFDQIAESRFARAAYAVWPGLPEADVRMWRDRGIFILDADPFGILGEVVTQPIPSSQPETTIPVTISSSPRGGNDMNYERGLQALESFVKPEDPDTWRDFTLYKGQLLENLGKERRFGTTETLRSERFQIVDKLNPMALRLTGLSFTDLCLGKQPTSKPQPASEAQEIIEHLRRIEEKLDQGHAEDRQAAEQILNALAQDRIAQDEAAQAVAELRAWTQSVQESGLPLSPELREALDALTEHTGSAYQYLQLALPIIPGILSYNVELGSQHQLDLKAIWDRIKTRLGKGAKGVDTIAGSETTYYGTGNAWAVLVGVNEYEDEVHYGRLQVCIKDVEAIRDQLVASGVETERVHLLSDHADELPTRDNVLVTLTAVAKATEPDDLLLFYYSGHGDEDGGESYLVARNGKKLALEDTAVRISRVKQIMEQALARAKVIVLDACHSGANISGKGPQKMTEEFVRRVFEQAAGLVILSSCQQGEVSYEWRENERSVFTHFLLEALEGQADRDEKGFVTVQDANRHVTNGVRLWASQRKLSQTPTLRAAVAGDIILARYQ
jgi:hypothetical protein